MLQQLPETGAARERRLGWVVPSVAVHLAIITAVGFAQAGGKEVPKPAFTVDTIVFPMPDRPDRVGSLTGRGPGRPPADDNSAARLRPVDDSGDPHADDLAVERRQHRTRWPADRWPIWDGGLRTQRRDRRIDGG